MNSKGKKALLERKVRQAPREQRVSSGAQGLQGPAGARGTTGAQGATGPEGPEGSPGADGKRMIYGDGSAGSKTVATNEFFDNVNPQFTDFTIESGVTLGIPSGTIIRCTGTFTNNGTLIVYPSYGQPTSFSSDGNYQATSPHPGISNTAAQSGIYSANLSSSIPNAAGGSGLVENEARTILRPGIVAGGQGGAAGAVSGSSGRAGGGGGIVHLLSPAIYSSSATITVTGGAAGSVGTPGLVSANPRTSGAGGGASGGQRGHGGGVDHNTSSSNGATAGSDGYVFQTVADPTGLL